QAAEATVRIASATVKRADQVMAPHSLTTGARRRRGPLVGPTLCAAGPGAPVPTRTTCTANPRAAAPPVPTCMPDNGFDAESIRHVANLSRPAIGVGRARRGGSREADRVDAEETRRTGGVARARFAGPFELDLPRARGRGDGEDRERDGE